MLLFIKIKNKAEINLDQIHDLIWKKVIHIFKHIFNIRGVKEMKSWTYTEL